MSLIQVNALTKHYGRVKALENASFTVEKGVTGLIGPNGAGKSTFIKIVLGLIRQTRGEAKIFGLDSRKERNKVMRRVGVLHEKPSLPPWVTARQYLEYVARLKRVPEVNGEILRVSEICTLTDYLDRRIGTYSAGMAQRLGLGGALVGKPDLVVLDEPTANLDPLGRHDVLAKIKRLRDEEGMNFLISTHILSELEKVSNNVVILNEGRVVTYGPLSELISKYSRLKYSVTVDNPKTFVAELSEQTREATEMRGDEVLIEVDDEERLVNELNRLFTSKTFRLNEFKRLTPTLEDIFVEAMRRKQVD